MDDMKMKAREALERLAVGYEFEERKIIADKNGKPQKVEVYKKHIPPDLNALRILLREFRGSGKR